jgi:hypothetical protein
MPKPDGVGTAAQRLRTAIEKLDACKDEKDEAVENLMKSLVDAKRRDISIDGYKFEMRHEGPKDTIKIVKPK